jgi:hypothetical protein
MSVNYGDTAAVDTRGVMVGMERSELLDILADIERRRTDLRNQMLELDKMQFWLFVMLGTSTLLLGGSMIWVAGCALARAAL